LAQASAAAVSWGMGDVLSKQQTDQETDLRTIDAFLAKAS
jgi:hypothetical protein